MKRLLLILLIASWAIVSFAQRPYGCTSAGKTLKYANYDADDNLTGYSVVTIKSVTGDGANMSVTAENTVLDVDGNALTSPIETTVTYENGEATVNVGGNNGMAVEVSGDKITLPSRLAVGMLLDLGRMNVTVSGISTTTTITENEVIDREELSTDAGIFKCYVVKQTSEGKVFGIKGVTTTMTWYARGVGAVKTEIYVKDKLSSKQILVQFN